MDPNILHSVYFGINMDDMIHTTGDHELNGMAKGINTWTDWHLIPSSRPEIVTPEVYTNYVDLPAAHGKVDLSEYLTGYPVYKNRSGSLEFYPANGYGFWAERYNQITNFLHGKKLFMVLYDEPEYFYTGRFKVERYESDGQTNWSTVPINYELDPFKFLLPRTSLDQYWDRYLFEDIHGYRYMENVASGQSFKLQGYVNGFMMDGLISDDSTFPASMTISLNNGSQTMTVSRANKNARTVHTGSIGPVVQPNNTISVSGTGLVNLVCWGGHL